MTDEGGALFVGTNDWSWDLKNTRQWAPKWWRLVNRVLQPGFGFDLWKSCDGVTWSPVTRNAFGVDGGLRGPDLVVPTSDGFILGTANIAHGTRIWQGHELSSCGSPSGRAVARRRRHGRAAAEPAHRRPGRRDGALVGALPRGRDVPRRARPVRRRAAEPAPAARDPESLPFDDAVPVVRPLGDAGQPRRQRPRPRSVPGGRDDDAHRVRRPRHARRCVRYVYRVVAETASGTTSAPSNLQQVPDPRPPATFAQLERAAHGSAAVAAIAQVRGDRAGVLARLAQLARTAGDDQVA